MHSLLQERGGNQMLWYWTLTFSLFSLERSIITHLYTGQLGSFLSVSIVAQQLATMNQINPSYQETLFLLLRPLTLLSADLNIANKKPVFLSPQDLSDLHSKDIKFAPIICIILRVILKKRAEMPPICFPSWWITTQLRFWTLLIRIYYLKVKRRYIYLGSKGTH